MGGLRAFPDDGRRPVTVDAQARQTELLPARRSWRAARDLLGDAMDVAAAQENLA